MRSILLYGAALIAPALFLVACDKPAAQTGQTAAMPPPEVAVIQAKAESIPLTRESVGRLAATRVAQVRARVAGIILTRVYAEGTDVKAGDVLFRIDPAQLDATLHAEEAALAKAEADAANAALIAKRYVELREKRTLSQQDLDTALANERTTAAAVKQVQANLEHLRTALGYDVVGPGTGPLAAGEGEGPGRMVDPDEIVEHVGRALGSDPALRGKAVLVTAGPTPSQNALPRPMQRPP